MYDIVELKSGKPLVTGILPQQEVWDKRDILKFTI